jgi:glyoxylase-like metal-dependent hydrolase (beta-lactamase superfamily II)
LLFIQVKKVGDNFSYVLADEVTKEAAVIDPSRNGRELARLLGENRLKLKYIVVTHHHPDHLGDSYELQSELGGLVVTSSLSGVKKDVALEDGETLVLGSVRLKVLHTPGHTPDSICILADRKMMTGDTLFVGECGRTDLPGGDPSKMYDSLLEKISGLGDDVEVYPGHDYGASRSSTVGEEKRTNYTLKKRTREEFIAFMNEP